MAQTVVGQVAVRVGADVGPLKIGLRDGSRAMGRFDKSTKGRAASIARNAKIAAAALVAMGTALVTASRRAIKAVDAIGKTADKIGLTTTSLQELRFAAESASVPIATLDMAMQRFTRRVAEARAGTGEAKAALAEMGIELVDAAGNALGIDAVLGQVADAMAATADQSDRVRLAMKLFDSEGVALVNMLSDGKRGLDDMRKAANEMGAVIGGDVVRKAEALETELGQVTTALSAGMKTALVELGPLLVATANLLAGLSGAGADVIKFIATLGGLLVDEPMGEFEQAIDNVTLAMGDELRQSQLLRAELQQGFVMTTNSARAKLEEAIARRKNVLAMLEEQRTAILQTEAYRNISSEIRRLSEEVQSLETVQQRARESGKNLPGLVADEESRAAELVNLWRLLNGLLQKRQAMILQVRAGLATGNAEVSKLNDLIVSLERAIEAAGGGVVDLGEFLVKPVELGERLSETLGGIKVGGVEGAKALAAWLGVSLETAQRLASFGPQGVPGPGTGGRGGDPRQFGGSIFDWQNRQGTAFLNNDTLGNASAVPRGGGASPLAAMIPTEEDFEALRLGHATAQEIAQVEYERELEQVRAMREAGVVSREEINALEAQIEEEHQRRLTQIRLSGERERLRAISAAFGDVASLMTTGNKTLFKIGQAAAIAQAVVDGYQAAVAAWNYGMGNGGPLAAAAFTAASLVKTGALIAKIKSASPGGSGSQANTGGGGGGTTATGAGASGGGQAQTSRLITVQLVGEGDWIHRDNLLNVINELVEDGGRLRFV